MGIAVVIELTDSNISMGLLGFPLEGSGDILFSIEPGCLSVHLSFTKLCKFYNLIPVRDISTKLHTLVKHIQTTRHAQEP